MAGDNSERIILFLFLALLSGCLVSYLLSRITVRISYYPCLFLSGVLLAMGAYHLELRQVGDSTLMWSNINPDLLLFVFLPPLFFGDSIKLNIYNLKRTFYQSFLLAGPGSLVCCILLAALCKIALPYNWSWPMCIVFSAMFCPTDPVASLGKPLLTNNSYFTWHL